jgi:hypothetical protein
VRDLILRRTPWQRAWAQDGRRPNAPITRWPLWLRQLAGVSGVYFFRETGKRPIIYIGRALDLHDRIRRHFNAWNEAAYGRAHHHATYDRNTIEVRVYVVAPENIAAVEAFFIAKCAPRDNRRAESAALPDREPGEDDAPIAPTAEVAAGEEPF